MSPFGQMVVVDIALRPKVSRPIIIRRRKDIRREVRTSYMVVATRETGLYITSLCINELCSLYWFNMCKIGWVFKINPFI